MIFYKQFFILIKINTSEKILKVKATVLFKLMKALPVSKVDVNKAKWKTI